MPMRELVRLARQIAASDVYLTIDPMVRRPTLLPLARSTIVNGEEQHLKSPPRPFSHERQGFQYLGFLVPTAPVYGLTLPVAL